MGHQIKLLSLIVLTLITTNAQAIYKCTVNGKTVYSDMKCATDAEVIDTDQSQRPSRTNTSSDYLTPDERRMLKSYENRKPKRNQPESLESSLKKIDDDYNREQCENAKYNQQDYKDQLRSGCRVSWCEHLKKEIKYWQRSIDRYCK